MSRAVWLSSSAYQKHWIRGTCFFEDTLVCYRLSDTVCISCIYRSAKRSFITPSFVINLWSTPGWMRCAVAQEGVLALEGSSSMLCSRCSLTPLLLLRLLVWTSVCFTVVFLQVSSEPRKGKKSEKNEKPSYLNDYKTSEVRPPLLTLTSWPWLSRSHVLKGTRTRRPHAKGRTKAWLEVLETGLCALWHNKGAITRPDCLPNTHFLESREFSLFRWVHWHGRDCLKTLATQILCIALNLWKEE